MTKVERLFPRLCVRETGGGIPPRKQPARGYADRHAGNLARKWTDEQILTMRGRYEFQGRAIEQIMAEFGCSRGWLYRVLDYSTRSKLEPRAEDFPRPWPGRADRTS